MPYRTAPEMKKPKETYVKTFADDLRELSGEINQKRKASVYADKLVEKHRIAAKEQATANAEAGMHSAQYIGDPPMTPGNLIPQEEIVHSIEDALRKEGLTVRAEVSVFDDRTNIKKLRVFMEW